MNDEISLVMIVVLMVVGDYRAISRMDSTRPPKTP